MSFKKFSQFKPINKDISHRQAKALYNNLKGGGSDISSKNMIEIEYEDLVTLRDEAKLIPGCYYRIIDYETTTSQDFTHSLGHPFDVVVLALSPDTLDENAKAMHTDRYEEFDVNAATLVKDFDSKFDAYSFFDEDYGYNDVRTLVTNIFNSVKNLDFILTKEDNQLNTFIEGGRRYGSRSVVNTVNGDFLCYLYSDDDRYLKLFVLKDTSNVYIRGWGEFRGSYFNLISLFDSFSAYASTTSVWFDVSDLFEIKEKTIQVKDNYFDRINLKSWKLKYSLTNDNDKFSWGNDIVVDIKKIDVSESNLDISSFNLSTKYGTQGSDVYILTDVELSTNNANIGDDHPTNKYYILDTPIFVGDKIYFYTYDGTNYTISKNYFVVKETYDENEDVAHFQKNKGVIYELIDELNNRAGFEFYNIITDIASYLEFITFRTVNPMIEGMDDIPLFNFEGVICENNFVCDCFHFNSSFGTMSYSIPYGIITGRNNTIYFDDDVYNVFAIFGDNNTINCNNNFIDAINLTITRDQTPQGTIMTAVTNMLNCASPLGNWCIKEGALYEIPNEELFQSMFTD